jgi:hypothetical protein
VDSLQLRVARLYITQRDGSILHSVAADRGNFAVTTTDSSLEESPMSQDDDSTDRAAVIQAYHEDSEMQQVYRAFEVVDSTYVSGTLLTRSKIESISCSSCVVIPNVDYEISVRASSLWSQVSQR